MTFSGKLQPQAWMVAPETQRVMQALRSDGGDARFVGGCVRNALANRRVTDIDIATPLTPEQVIERLEAHKIDYAPTGMKHGTVTAIADGHPFEITTLRLDVMTFGRHAEVKFTDDWKTDASRRDFTINTIYATAEGDLFDPFGGIEDLRLGLVRFVGEPERRIHEDVLRILRFFRFYAHFGQGKPDDASLKACMAAAPEIKKLSAERVRQEILKLLESDRCPMVWQLMLRGGVVTHFLPEATNIQALENIVRLEAATHNPAFPLRRLAAVIDVTATGLENISKGLRLSHNQSDYLLKMIGPAHALPENVNEADVKRLVYHQGNDTVRSLLLLSAARSGGEAHLLPLYETATTFRPPRFPLTGEDALNIGYPRGPAIGQALGVVEEWWIGEDFKPGRAECLKKLGERFGFND